MCTVFVHNRYRDQLQNKNHKCEKASGTKSDQQNMYTNHGCNFLALIIDTQKSFLLCHWDVVKELTFIHMNSVNGVEQSANN